MNLIQLLKGVWNKMVGPKTVESVLHITPAISTQMRDAIELWEQMYTNNSPWLTENVKSLGLASLIASEKAQTATIEMEVKITGDNERAEFMRTQFKKVLSSIRKELEYGIAFGGLVIKPYPVMGVDGKYVLEFNYTKANNFYPLSFSTDGKLTEAAFIDRIITKDKVFSKVEYHSLKGTKLTVRNLAFESSNINYARPISDELGDPISLTSIPAWANIEPIVSIDNIDTQLFAYFKMPQANTVDLNSPLGVSGFSRAIGLIRSADEQYSNLLWEFEGGQLAIDVDRTALIPMKDSKGNMVEVMPKLQERLFRANMDLGDDYAYNIFSPNLRDKNIVNGLNEILTKIEDACALSRGTLSNVSISEARTATELKILKQRSYSANHDIQKTLEETLENVFKIMDKYCDLYKICPQGDYEVAYKWDDSIIVDKDSERQVDLLDVNAGLLSKVEYRMKWMGETETQAEEALKRIEDERKRQMEMETTITETTTNVAQDIQDKLQRANESVETTEISEKNS